MWDDLPATAPSTTPRLTAGAATPFPVDLTRLGGKILSVFFQPKDELRELAIARARIELEQLLGQRAVAYTTVPLSAVLASRTIAISGPRGSGKTALALSIAQADTGRTIASNAPLPPSTTEHDYRASVPLRAIPNDCTYLYDDAVKPDRRDPSLVEVLQHSRHRDIRLIVTAPLPTSHQLETLRYVDSLLVTGGNRANWALHDLPEPWPDRLGQLLTITTSSKQPIVAGWEMASDLLFGIPRPPLPVGWEDRISRWNRT